MILDSLHPEVRDALVGCCAVKAFDEQRFNSLLAEYGLSHSRAALLDEVYQATVFAACERRRQARRLERAMRPDRPSLN